MEGAFEAMAEGTVDVNWAKEHHSLWLKEEMIRTGRNTSRPQPELAKQRVQLRNSTRKQPFKLHEP